MRDKYCLESVLPFQSINQSQTNRSRTKQTFSFSKSPRFANTQPNCPVSSYAGDKIMRKNSGTSIGYGKKSDFTKDLTASPQSTRYNIKNIFDLSSEKRKGYTLTLGREKIAFDSYINPEKLRIPGVARYHLETQSQVREERAPAYSMRTRTRIFDPTKTLQPLANNPSPAAYENNPQKARNLFGSNFKRISYGTSRSRRFLNSDNKMPGPGQYENPTNLSTVGKYVVSSQKGGTNAKFDSSKRITEFQQSQRVSQTKPGPGAYRLSSEFGQYDGNVYNYKIQTNRSIKKFTKN